MKYNLIYITTKDKEEAQNIGEILVKDRLAACANITDNMQSIYWWDNKVQNSTEATLILKTKESLVVELTKRAKSLHSYECPCIVALPISGGNQEYLNWIEKETQ